MGNTHFDTNNSKSNPEEFILKYNKSNENKLTDALLLDNRRVVFVSLIGLYNTWNKCPPVLLHSALCVLPLKRNWIYQPSKYMNEMQTKYEKFAPFQYIQHKIFLQLLKWKDSQGNIFFMLDEINDTVDCNNNRLDAINVDNNNNNNNNNKEDMISQSWHALSDKLTTLYDPITGNTYNPIIFDPQFWTQKYDKQINCQSRFGAKSVSVLVELYGLSNKMKYKSLQEIIYQSNPKSLNVIISYTIKKQIPVFTETEINGQTGWVLSSDYS